MDSDTKLLFTLSSLVAVVFLGFFACFAYRDNLRTDYLSTASDPVAAACAFDSNENAVPPSCLIYLYQQKEVFNEIR